MPSKSLRQFKVLAQSPSFSLYDVSLKENVPSNFCSFVVSTPETRKLVTDPFVIGCSYRKALRKAAFCALGHSSILQILKKAQETKLNVLHFLRGGLSYQLLEALNDLGFENAKGSFMSSERTFVKKNSADEKHWIIQKDQYVELTLEEGSVLLIGDICASGSTLKAGLAKIAQRYSGLSWQELPSFIQEHLVTDIHPLHEKEKPKGSVRHIIYFTTGNANAELVLAEYHGFFESIFPNYSGTTIVFIEAIFHVADSSNPVFNGEIGTDLVPWKMPAAAPEYEKELQKNPLAALEQCVVYDGGSRSFNSIVYWASLRKYAEKVQASLNQGKTAFDLVFDRWDYAGKLPLAVQENLKKPVTGKEWVEKRLKAIEQCEKS
jgi:hypothetical protein